MLVERFKYEHTLRQNGWQHYNYHLATVAGFKQSASCFAMFLVVLYQIADDDIGIDKPPLTHVTPHEPVQLL